MDLEPTWIAVGGLDHLLYVAGVVLLGALLVWRCEWVRERARPVRAAAFAVVLLPVFAWIADGWRPIRAGLRTAVGWFVMYVTGAVAVNALTGGNYFYQRERPVLPWLDQPWYLLGSVAVSLLLFVVGHAGARWIGARVDGVTPPPAPEATGASRSRDDAGAARVGA